MGSLSTTIYSRPEWVRRFAYRAMLCRNELDTTSALSVADMQFDVANGSDPEVAAEAFANRAPYAANGRATHAVEQETRHHSARMLSTA